MSSHSLHKKSGLQRPLSSGYCDPTRIANIKGHGDMVFCYSAPAHSSEATVNRFALARREAAFCLLLTLLYFVAWYGSAYFIPEDLELWDPPSGSCSVAS